MGCPLEATRHMHTMLMPASMVSGERMENHRIEWSDPNALVDVYLGNERYGTLECSRYFHHDGRLHGKMLCIALHTPFEIGRYAEEPFEEVILTVDFLKTNFAAPPYMCQRTQQVLRVSEKDAEALFDMDIFEPC